MKTSIPSAAGVRLKREVFSDLLILRDGGILAHNVTPVLAEILAELVPGDQDLRERATCQKRDVSSPRKKA